MWTAEEEVNICRSECLLAHCALALVSAQKYPTLGTTSAAHPLGAQQWARNQYLTDCAPGIFGMVSIVSTPRTPCDCLRLPCPMCNPSLVSILFYYLPLLNHRLLCTLAYNPKKIFWTLAPMWIKLVVFLNILKPYDAVKIFPLILSC